jgi:hypothetical protein
MNENFAYTAKGGVGPVCVTDYEQSEKFCIESGKIAAYKYDIVDEKNMAGTTEIKQLDDQCLEAKTMGTPRRQAGLQTVGCASRRNVPSRFISPTVSNSSVSAI